MLAFSARANPRTLNASITACQTPGGSAPMPSLPPPELVLDVVLYAVLPALAASAAVFALILWLAPPREEVVILAGALALVAGFLAGNWFRDALPLVPGPSPWQRLAGVAVAALAVGCLVRLPKMPTWAGWVLRTLTALAAGWLLVPAEVRGEHPWLVAVFAAVLLLEWAWVEYAARQGPGPEVPFALALAHLGAATVL